MQSQILKPNFINAYVSKSEIKTTYSLKINDEKEAQFGKTFEALPHKTQKTQPFLRAFCSLSYSPDNHQIKKPTTSNLQELGERGNNYYEKPLHLLILYRSEFLGITASMLIHLCLDSYLLTLLIANFRPKKCCLQATI